MCSQLDPTANRRPSSERPRGSGETVLVVDDEPSILHVARVTLQRQGYRVLLAARGDEAVSLYRQHSGSVAVVVTDMMMPGLDGRATIAAMRQLNAGVRIVACSGVPIEDMGNSEDHPSVEFLPKPYSAEALLTALRRTLARPA